LLRESTPLAVNVSDPHEARLAVGTTPGSRPAKYVKLREIVGMSARSFVPMSAADLDLAIDVA